MKVQAALETPMQVDAQFASQTASALNKRRLHQPKQMKGTMTNHDEEKIELSDNQQSPYQARPEDFTVMPASEAAKRSLPGHGQHGNTQREYAAILNDPRRGFNKSKPTGKGVTLPTPTDEAGPPHSIK
jgi:hypothetical protein